jgi:hypothetical protein
MLYRAVSFVVVLIYDDNYNINSYIILNTGKLSLSPLSQWRYQLEPSSILLLHIIKVNTLALPHCHVGDKQERSDIRDCITVEFPTCFTIYVLKSNCDKT